MYTLQSNDGCVVLGRGSLRLRIRFVSASIARVTLTEKKPFQSSPSVLVTPQATFSDYLLEETPACFTIRTSQLTLSVDRKCGGITYQNGEGEVLLREPERGGKWLTAKKVYRSASNGAAWMANPRNVDNAREVFEAKLEFVFAEKEALFGLGSHEEGYGNLRGKSRELYQHPRKMPIPYFVSTKNYGILLDCASLLTFHDDCHGSYLWCDVVDELDYYFIHGDRFDQVTAGYHQLTGGVPLLPKYAFGYIQSKEHISDTCAGEGYAGDWSSGPVAPEPHLRLIVNVQYLKQSLDPGLINLDPLRHSRSLDEGQGQKNKRVLLLSHSSYAGEHRSGTVARSGNLSATWESLRRCIPEGVHYCASGEPYWTSEIGGSFLHSNGQDWFCNGDYSEDGSDLAYWELYLRWFQYGAFLPIFANPGGDLERFGKPGTKFYEILLKFIRLRYQLLPYIYSLAGQITLNSSTMMRAVAFDYPGDEKSFDLTDQYLFGSALMVCPVTTASYYEKDSQPIGNASKCRSVYLPAGREWYDFWHETVYEGGQTLSAYAPLEILPLFVPSGSIIPMTEVMEHVQDNPRAPYEIRVYRGSDGRFTIYEDAGENCDYQQGQYALIDLIWNESGAQLTIGARRGAFPGLVRERVYKILFISKGGRSTQRVDYHGKEIQISAPRI